MSTEINGTPTPPAKPENYLVWAILSTVLCCMPFGVVSIVYASKVDSLWTMGQYTAAEEAAQKAKKWFWAALGCGAAIGFFYLIYMIVVMGFAFADIL